MRAENRPKVFLDTNVLASAAYGDVGPPARLVEMHDDGLIRIHLSQRVLDEVAFVVARKLATATEKLRSIIANPQLVILTDTSGHALRTVNEDDRSIVAAAIEGDVDYFVTGDRALLKECRALKRKRPRFVSPRELVDLIEPGS